MKKTSIAALAAILALGACDDGHSNPETSSSQGPEKLYENPNERTADQLRDMFGFSGSNDDP